MPNLGIKVRDERSERTQANLGYCKQQEQSQAETKRRQCSLAYGQKQLARLRKSLNMPARTKVDTESS